MNVLIDFLVINNVRPLDNLLAYTKKIISDLLTKGLITQLTIARATLEFGDCSSVTELSDTAFITNYIYAKENHTTHWQLTMEFGTFTSSNQLQIKVLSDDYKLKIEENYLEQLKLAIKNIVKADWENIIWLMDKDSEMLSIALYPSIYRVENLSRQLINEIMTKEYGIGWWDIYVPIQIQNKHRARMGGYKSIVPGFANVDERLMSIDIGDLITIFTLKKEKWTPAFNAEIDNFLTGQKEIKIERIKEILALQLEVTKDLWEEQFSNYLSYKFISKLREFELNRNHVVHNKLIDRAAYGIICDCIREVENELTGALNRVAEIVISTEQREDIAIQLEIEKMKAQEHLLEIMESEAGVRIRNNDEIIELFDERLYEFHSEFQSHLRFRHDIEIGDYQNISSANDSGTLFEIIYKISDETVRVNYTIDLIDSSQGGESSIRISIQAINENYSKPIRYINGEVSFNTYQGTYMPETQDAFYVLDLEELMDELMEYFDTYFENMCEKVDSDMYSIIKDGGNSPVADGVYCWDCGEEYVCIDETYGTFGQCLNCGEMNEVSICARCGCFFEGTPSVDEPDFCDNCLDDFESQ